MVEKDLSLIYLPTQSQLNKSLNECIHSNSIYVFILETYVINILSPFCAS